MKKNKSFVVDNTFIKEVLKENLSLKEFLLLLYFDNSFDSIFDTTTISKVLNMSIEDIIMAYSTLLSKKIIEVKTIKDSSGKVVEEVSLDNFYSNIEIENMISKKSSEKDEIYHEFEKSFGRTLSGVDVELINAWIDKGFSEDLIKAALSEAVYNGTTSLRYIDKILYEWNRKGIKNVSDIKNKMYEEENPDLIETKVLNFDWLDEK